MLLSMRSWCPWGLVSMQIYAIAMSNDGHENKHFSPNKFSMVRIYTCSCLYNTGCMYCDTNSKSVYIPYYSAFCQCTTQVNDTRKCQLVQYIKSTSRHECLNCFICLLIVYSRKQPAAMSTICYVKTVILTTQISTAMFLFNDIEYCEDYLYNKFWP